MHFVIIARDALGPEIAGKRSELRPQHLAGIEHLKREGNLVGGGPLLDDAGQVIGSIIICGFPHRAALDEYLSGEVYVRHEVWRDIEVVRYHRVD